LSDRPSSTSAQAGSSMPPEEPPVSLREQLGRTIKAAVGLLTSHVRLAVAETTEIAKRVAALGGIALMFLICAAVLFTVGMPLLLGEALFGSIGWGILIGTELLVAIAAILVLALIELHAANVAAAVGIGLVVAAVVAAVLLSNWTWFTATYVGSPDVTVQLLAAAAAGGVVGAIAAANGGSRGILLGFVALAVVGAALRLLFGVFASTSVMVAVLAGVFVVGVIGALLAPGRNRATMSAGFLAGAVLGIGVGLIAGGRPSRHVVGALAVSTWLLVLPIAAAYFTFRHGVDVDKLKKRYMPTQTIETTKETIEWVRAQMPLGPKS
jgi:hypothetical protein